MSLSEKSVESILLAAKFVPIVRVSVKSQFRIVHVMNAQYSSVLPLKVHFSNRHSV